MADHDPLCPVVHSAIECGYCVLIARVRADERERWRKPCECPIAFHEAEVRERIAQEIEADHATGPLCKAFGGGANVCTHGRDAAIARGAS